MLDNFYASGYARQERDLYETPEWVTRALFRHVTFKKALILEPAAGSGKMSRAIKVESGGCVVFASDIHPLDPDVKQVDFLARDCYAQTDSIVTNPPFGKAAEFINQALKFTRANIGKVAMLLPTNYDCAQSRMHLFDAESPFAKKIVLTKRIVWFAQRGGSTPAPKHNHAWYVWDWAKPFGQLPQLTYDNGKDVP